MNQILALREKRANLWNQTKAFLDSHRGEDGMVSAEDNATYEKMEADVGCPRQGNRAPGASGRDRP